VKDPLNYLLVLRGSQVVGDLPEQHRIILVFTELNRMEIRWQERDLRQQV